VTKSAVSEIDKLKIIGMMIVIIAVTYAFRGYISRPFVIPHIPSDPYVWPAGCKPENSRGIEDNGHVRYYGLENKIPASCMDPQYYFPDAVKHNFPTQSGVGRNYYRVDRDALNFQCFDNGTCVVAFMVKDVFTDGN
jgi:hypothetical protein